MENEERFSKLMQKSRLEMPYSDFEDNMMLRIRKEIKYRKSITSNTGLSAIFFLLGAGFGLVVNTILSSYEGLIAGIPAEKFLFYFQIVYVLVIAAQFETILKMINKLRT